MVLGIMMIITGLIAILIPKTESYQDYIYKHNFADQEFVMNTIRNMIAGILFLMGTIILLFKLFIGMA